MDKCTIIAEAGVNHNGSLALAKKLVEQAAEAGADFVKFQTFKAERLVSPSARKAAYQAESTGDNSSQYEMLKKLELSAEDFIELQQHCNLFNIKFLSTAFDLESIQFLASLRMEVFKIPSGEITNVPYLKSVAATAQNVILSSGMSTLGEIEKALKIVLDAGVKRENVTILHCNTEYPTPYEDVNLKAMVTIGNSFKVKVGYSDHTSGIEIPIAAVALGASVIEKHFTLDKNMEGPDHQASLDPAELKEMVQGIRRVEQALGSGIKEPSKSESKNIDVARKSIHLNKAMAEGETITEDSLIMLRPGDGISPFEIDSIIGRRTARKLDAGYKLKYTDIAN